MTSKTRVMNSYQMVKKAIEFSGPERVPLVFPGYFPPDIISLPYAEIETQTSPKRTDEWGCVWESKAKTMGKVTHSPLSDWENISHYSFPTPREEHFRKIKRHIHQNKGKRYILGSVAFTLWERMRYLRGFRNLLEDFYLHPPRLKILADKIMNFQLQLIKMWSKIGVDGVFFSDDWGTNKGLFINPEHWRALFKPRYIKLCDAARTEGLHVFFHSDGQILEIIPDFIDCGVDVLEVAQPHLLGIEKVGRRFGGLICFYGATDKQTTLISGTREDIIQEVKTLVQSLGSFNGGFIAMGDMQDFHDLEIPPKNIKTMVEMFRTFGKY